MPIRSVPLRLVLVLVSLVVTIQPVFAADPAGRFAVISDIHFNPFDPPRLARQLADADVTDWEAIFATIETQTAASYGSDTNYALLKSAIDAFAKAAANVDFVIMPGDFLSHRFQQKAADALGTDPADDAVKTLAGKTAVYVAEVLREAVPGRPLIPALGNTDAVCGDYQIEPGGPFLTATARAVRDSLGDAATDPDFEETYRAGGYFAVRHPLVSDTVTIVLNDVLWSTRYSDACGDGRPNGSRAMLEWLEARLETARAAGDRVWIVYHVPIGIDAYSTAHSKETACDEKPVPFLREPYSTRYPALLRDYADMIVASFAGHVHYDGYRLLTGDAGTALGVTKIVPAISPVFGQNPGFQIFSYDLQSGAPTDFETWYLDNLEETSLATPGDWRREYRFTEAYGLPSFSAQATETLWRAASSGPGPDRDAFARFYPVSHGQFSDTKLPAYLCAMRYQSVDTFSACYCGQ